MRVFGTVLAVLLVLATAGATVTWWKINYPILIYRYKMTVNVRVDGELKSNSAIIEVQLEKQPALLPEVIPVLSHVLGEAVYLDLGSGYNLVALLAAGPNAENTEYPESVVPTHFKLTYSDSDLEKYPQLQGQWDLSPRELPTFVTFGDLKDLLSARVVLPDQFGQAFGPKVELQNVRIEMTREPRTRGIDQKMLWWNGPFPWLQRLGSGASVDTRSGPLKLTKEHFKRDI